MVLALAWCIAGATPAEAVTVNACLAGKLADVGGSVVSRAACLARDAGNPDSAALALCLAKASRRFDGGSDPALGRFAKRERRPPCITSGDQAAEGAAIASYVAALDARVANAGAVNRCDATTFGCVGRYVGAVSGCLARAAKATGVIDARCLAKERVRLTDAEHGCLRKAALRGPCSRNTTAATYADAADAFAAETLCALDPSGTGQCPPLPTPAATPTRTPTPTATWTPTPFPTPNGNDVEQLCVDTINAYRASIGRPPYARWTAAEVCADNQCVSDGQSHVAHGAFGQCGEWAQNECPGWPGPPEAMIQNCLQMMWTEGPGSDFPTHGHYINMASTSYTKVACGFAVMPNGSVWAVQDFQ